MTHNLRTTPSLSLYLGKQPCKISLTSGSSKLTASTNRCQTTNILASQLRLPGLPGLGIATTKGRCLGGRMYLLLRPIDHLEDVPSFPAPLGNRAVSSITIPAPPSEGLQRTLIRSFSIRLRGRRTEQMCQAASLKRRRWSRMSPTGRTWSRQPVSWYISERVNCSKF